MRQHQTQQHPLSNVGSQGSKAEGTAVGLGDGGRPGDRRASGCGGCRALSPLLQEDGEEGQKEGRKAAEPAAGQEPPPAGCTLCCCCSARDRAGPPSTEPFPGSSFRSHASAASAAPCPAPAEHPGRGKEDLAVPGGTAWALSCPKQRLYQPNPQLFALGADLGVGGPRGTFHHPCATLILKPAEN